MNRRSFLGLMAAFVADPERLLWVPGKKLISIPAATSTVYTKEAMELLRQFSYYFHEYFYREDPLLKALKAKHPTTIDGGTYVEQPLVYDGWN